MHRVKNHTYHDSQLPSPHRLIIGCYRDMWLIIRALRAHYYLNILSTVLVRLCLRSVPKDQSYLITLPVPRPHHPTLSGLGRSELEQSHSPFYFHLFLARAIVETGFLKLTTVKKNPWLICTVNGTAEPRPSGYDVLDEGNEVWKKIFCIEAFMIDIQGSFSYKSPIVRKGSKTHAWNTPNKAYKRHLILWCTEPGRTNRK